MADRKVEPVEHKDEHQPSSSQSDPKDAQSTSSIAQEGTQSSARTSAVRNTILDEVVANQHRQIAELERKVEKKKETFRKLSSPSPFIAPPGLGVVPPHISPSTVQQASASLTSPVVGPQANKPNPSPTVTKTTNSSQHQTHHSQPLAHSNPMNATVAAMAAASTPVSTALHPHFSFFPYPHPDNHVMAFGVVPTIPPHPAAQPLQPPNSSTPSQPNQSSDDGANRQSRYWTPDEHQRFLAGRRTYGPRNYQQIAEVVGTRNAKQVRTHSQKYQQRLEREEARRRGGDGRISSDVQSGVKAVAPKLTASSDGNSTHVPNPVRQTEVNRNTSSPASGKNSQSNEAPHSAKSAEGSSSVNNGSAEAGAENNIIAVHVNAAARAVAAEAVALSRGKLPPGAMMMLEKPQVSQPHCTPHTQPIRPRETNTLQQDSFHTQSAPTTLNATVSAKGVRNGNHSKSHAAKQPSKHSNDSSSCADAQVTTPTPVSGGEDIHQVGEPEHEKEAADKISAQVSSQEQPHQSVNGTILQTQRSIEKRPDRRQRRSAVKIEPRVDSSTSPGLRPGTKLVPVCNPSSPIEMKSTVTPVMKTVKTNGSAERIEKKSQETAIKVKPADKVEVEETRSISLSKNDSAVAHPEKGILTNGHHSSKKSDEVTPREDSQGSKLDDSPRSPKCNTSGNIESNAGSGPKQSGSPQHSNYSMEVDSGDVNGRRQNSTGIVGKGEEFKVQVLDAKGRNRTEAGYSKDIIETGAVLRPDAVEAMAICTDEGNVELSKENELGINGETSGMKVDDTEIKEIKEGEESGESKKCGEKMGSETSPGQDGGDEVERMGVIAPNGNGHKEWENAKTSDKRGDDEADKDREDVKRKLEDVTECAGKRRKV